MSAPHTLKAKSKQKEEEARKETPLVQEDELIEATLIIAPHTEAETARTISWESFLRQRESNRAQSK